MAHSNNAVTFLGEISTVARDVYFPTFLETLHLNGSNTNKLFQPSQRRFQGATLEVQAATSHSHPVRTGRDVAVAFDQTKKFRSGSYILTLSETTASNDFAVHRASVRVSDLDIQRVYNGQATAVNIVDRLMNEVTTGFNAKFALYTHLTRQALVGLVNGTPVANDATTYAAATTTVTTTGMRIKVDGGVFGAFKPGLRVSIHNPATTRAYRTLDGTKYAIFEVMDANPADFSVGLAAIDAGTTAATGEYLSLDTAFDMTSHTVANNDEIYFLNEYYDGTSGQGMNSMGEWFNAGSTLYTRNRSTASYRWMNPRVFAGSGGAIAMTDLDTVCRGMGYESENMTGAAMVAITTPEIAQAMINDIFAGITPYSTIPTSGDGSVLARFGYDGIVYHHQTFGPIKIISDNYAVSNKVRFVRLGDWERVNGIGSGEPVRSMEGTAGMFSRAVNSSGVPTNEWQADFYAINADICTAPNMQAELNNITGV